MKRTTTTPKQLKRFAKNTDAKNTMFKELLKTISRYYPALFQDLGDSEGNDPRHQSYIIYTMWDLLIPLLMARIMGKTTMGSYKDAFEDADALRTIKLLCPVGETWFRFLYCCIA